MIRGVTFDWWHTIAEPPWPEYDERMRSARTHAVRQGLTALGHAVPLDRLVQAYDRHTDLLVGRWRDRRDLTSEEQVEAFLRLAGLDGSDSRAAAIVERAFAEAFRGKPPILYPHIADVLPRLKGLGLRVGLVSNTGRTWGRLLREAQDDLGIGRHFDVRVFSDEVGARKPARRIFDVAAEGLGLASGELVHVGDDVDADVAGAKDAGMRAVWFNTGFWAGASTGRADAEIRDHSDLIKILGGWRE